MSVLVTSNLLSLLKSFEIHPLTFDEWQIGPSTTTPFLFVDTTATGHVPNDLKILTYKELETNCIMALEGEDTEGMCQWNNGKTIWDFTGEKYWKL